MDRPAHPLCAALRGPWARLRAALASRWGRRLRRGALLAAAAALLWKAGRRVLQHEVACQESEAEFQKSIDRASHQLLSMLPALLERCNVHAHFSRLKEAQDREAKVQQWQAVKLETFASLLLLGYSLALLQTVTLVSHVVQHLSRRANPAPADMMQALMSCLLPDVEHGLEPPLFTAEHFLSEGVGVLRMAIVAAIAPDVNDLNLREYVTSERLLALFDEARMRFELSSPNINLFALVAGHPEAGEASVAHEAFQDVVEHPNFRQMLRHVEDTVFAHLAGFIRAAFDQARQTHRGDAAPASPLSGPAPCATGEEAEPEGPAVSPAKALVCVLPRLAFVASRVLEDRCPAPPPALVQFTAALQLRR